MKKGEKYLPIGTVVTLDENNKKAMIIGFGGKSVENKEKIWDYVGVLYPEGLVTTKKMLVFDHEAIEEIYHLGLINDEEKKLKYILKNEKYLEDILTYIKQEKGKMNK